MGWALNNCSVGSQSPPAKYLTIEISKSNTSGNSQVSSFINFLRQRNLSVYYSTTSNENLKDVIIIKYNAGGQENVIYEGSDLTQEKFDSLYRKIIS